MNLVARITKREDLNEDSQRVYRNFNIFLLIGLADLLVIIFVLKDVGAVWPLYMCVAEFSILLSMLLLHMHGHYISARYITFLITPLIQALASITHGKDSGFDYLFFIISVLPLLFFEKRWQYISLFIYSITIHLFVQYNYTQIKPFIIIDSSFPVYWNIFFTGIFLFGVLFTFKMGYQRTQESLRKKNVLITNQKEEIESINNNLEKIVVQRTQKVREHEQLIVEYANVNAHKVRSPLARIMGLLNLIELEKDKEKTLKDFLPILKSNAEELANTLDEVSKSLNAIKSEEDKI